MSKKLTQEEQSQLLREEWKKLRTTTKKLWDAKSPNDKRLFKLGGCLWVVTIPLLIWVFFFLEDDREKYSPSTEIHQFQSTPMISEPPVKEIPKVEYEQKLTGYNYYYICSDGSRSYAYGKRGACSRHGGIGQTVKEPVYERVPKTNK